MNVPHRIFARRNGPGRGSLLPSVLRGTSRRSPATAQGEIVYAIGDIHGRFDLYSSIIELIREDYHRNRRLGVRPRVVILGDFVDRGPDPAKLIANFRSVQKHGAALDVLLGNHEALLLDSVMGNDGAQKLWLKMGGGETLASFGIEARRDDEDSHAFAARLVDGIGTEVVDWLRDRPLSRRSGDYLLCHAGVKPGVPLHRQSREDMLWIRKPFLESDRDHGAIIVHGHSIVDRVEIGANRISVDTGAYRSNVLSAVCLDGTKLRVLTT